MQKFVLILVFLFVAWGAFSSMSSFKNSPDTVEQKDTANPNNLTKETMINGEHFYDKEAGLVYFKWEDVVYEVDRRYMENIGGTLTRSLTFARMWFRMPHFEPQETLRNPNVFLNETDRDGVSFRMGFNRRLKPNHNVNHALEITDIAERERVFTYKKELNLYEYLKKHKISDSYYYIDDLANPNVKISCSDIVKTPFPGCRMIWYGQYIYFSANFAYKYLANWQAIKDNAMLLIHNKLTPTQGD